jgi:hypothetical protein
MKLYETVVQTGADSFLVVWNGSASDASKQRTTFKKEGHKHPDTAEHEVPTNKVDLLAWLNENKVTV